MQCCAHPLISGQKWAHAAHLLPELALLRLGLLYRFGFFPAIKMGWPTPPPATSIAAALSGGAGDAMLSAAQPPGIAYRFKFPSMQRPY